MTGSSGDLMAGALVLLAALLWPGARSVDGLGAADRSDVAADELEPATGPLTVDDVASTMVLLSLALRSGSGVIQSIEQVAQVSAPAARRDLRSVTAALLWGVDERVAWASVPAAWGRAGRALRLARTAGIPPAALLLAGAQDLRAEQAQRLDLAAARVGVRLVLPLGLAFLPAFCLTTVVPIVAALARQVLSP